MDSSKTQRLLISLAATLCLILAHSTPASSDDDVYEILQDYSFPIGLLPEGVLSYDLDTSTGKFTVYLNDTCSFSKGKYQWQYKPTVRGYLSEGKLSHMHGVSVKFFHVWMNIAEIILRDDAIDVSLGVGKAGFPIDYFKERPRCDLTLPQGSIVSV